MAKALYVTDVEVLTTRSMPPRLIVKCTGRVSSTGWTDPRLEPWVYIAPPADGLLDFDLSATPPSGPSGAKVCDIAAETSLWLPKWCKGVRIHASANKVDAYIPGFGPNEVTNPTSSANTQSTADPGDNWPMRDPDNWPWLIAPDSTETISQLVSFGARSGSDAPISSLIGRPARVIRDGDAVDRMHWPERVTIVLARDKNVIVDVMFG